jgi:hypothetical protein
MQYKLSLDEIESLLEFIGEVLNFWMRRHQRSIGAAWERAAIEGN